jgi:hypothetical protein
VRFDEAFDDGQPEAGAAAVAGANLPEAVEQMRQLRGRNPGTCVGDGEPRLVAIALDACAFDRKSATLEGPKALNHKDTKDTESFVSFVPLW